MDKFVTFVGKKIARPQQGDYVYCKHRNVWHRGHIAHVYQKTVSVLSDEGNMFHRVHDVWKVNKVILPKIVLDKISKLWFIYGNNGKHHTNAGHYLCQRFLDTPDLNGQRHWMTWANKAHKGLLEAMKHLGLTARNGFFTYEDTRQKKL